MDLAFQNNVKKKILCLSMQSIYIEYNLFPTPFVPFKIGVSGVNTK